MIQATGCISVASEDTNGVRLDRIIESVCPEPHRETCTIWADIFAHNPTAKPQPLILLHRGSVRARNTTITWSCEPAARDEEDKGTQLTQCLLTLHQQRDPIVRANGHVQLGSTTYALDAQQAGPILVIGDVPHDVPYTMWRIGPVPPNQRSLIRIELTLSSDSYRKQIGPQDTFYAYGEAILLDTIERDDLFWYNGPGAQNYRDHFQQFKAARHLVPDFFEYIIVTMPPSQTTWEAIPLSPRLYAEPIPDALTGTAHWFITDHRHGDTWSLVGKRYNGLVIKLHAREADQQPCAAHS